MSCLGLGDPKPFLSEGVPQELRVAFYQLWDTLKARERIEDRQEGGHADEGERHNRGPRQGGEVSFSFEQTMGQRQSELRSKFLFLREGGLGAVVHWGKVVAVYRDSDRDTPVYKAGRLEMKA